MKCGYNGKILFVNLTKRRIEIEKPSQRVYHRYLGGIGIGAKMIYEKQKPKIAPLCPDNMTEVSHDDFLPVDNFLLFRKTSYEIFI